MLNVPQVLKASSGWTCIHFISDVHLHESDQATFLAWLQYLQSAPCQALFILGDLFEAWVGDDVVDHPTEGAFWRSCLNAIQQASLRMDVFFMHGNRDFLVGASAIKQAGMQLIADPTQLIWNEKIALLSHGDALCVADTAYQAFRQQVRTPVWQSQFLAHPLDERLAQARAMRQQSQHMQAQATQWADVDEPLATQWLMAANALTLIHGHTHRPAHHALPQQGLSRWVLSDWHADAAPARLQVLEWQTGKSPQGRSVLSFFST